TAACQLLAQWSNIEVHSLPREAKDVASECGNLPFALALCVAMARDGAPWVDLLSALRETDLDFIGHKLPNYPFPNVLRSLQVSTDRLTKENPNASLCYLQLAVFVASVEVPEATVRMLWNYTRQLTDRQVRDLLVLLASKALLNLTGLPPN